MQRLVRVVLITLAVGLLTVGVAGCPAQMQPAKGDKDKTIIAPKDADKAKGFDKDGVVAKDGGVLKYKGFAKDKGATTDGIIEKPSSADKAKSADGPKKIAKETKPLTVVKKVIPVPPSVEPAPSVVNHGVEVFYGTNRKPRGQDEDPREQMRHEILRDYFFTSLGWIVSLKLFLVCCGPPGYIRFASWLSARGNLALAALLVAGLGAVAWFTEEWWAKPQTWFLAVLAAGSALLFLGVWYGARTIGRLAQLSTTVKAASVAVLWSAGWLGTWAAVAWHNAAQKLDDEGPEIVYTCNFADALEYGICRVSMPPQRKPGQIKVPSGTIIREELDKEEHFFFLALPQRFEPARRTEFFQEVQLRVHHAGNPHLEAFVYIHGFNNNFREVAFRAAALKTDLNFPGPALFFSWPARGHVEDYAADEEAVDYSHEFFEQFLQEVAEQSGAQRIYLIAHSMGNRAMAQTLINLQRRHWDKLDRFPRVVLAAPDINRQSFLLKFVPDLLRLRVPITLYASDHDRALKTSRTIHKNARAGMAGADMVPSHTPFLETIDVSPIQAGFLGHDYAFSTRPVLDDLASIWKKNPLPIGQRLKPATTEAHEPYWILKGSP